MNSEKDFHFCIIPKAEAKPRGLKEFLTGVPCKRGHVSNRKTSDGSCVACKALAYQENREERDRKNKEWAKKNPEARKSHQKKWEENNKDYIKQKAAAYYLTVAEERREAARLFRIENPEEAREKDRLAREKNPDRVAESHKKYRTQSKDKVKKVMRRYCENNPDKVLARVNKRRAAKLQRTFNGYDEEILAIYTEARSRRDSGEAVEVDHILPLQGELISGLHVPWNLAIVSTYENRAKNNRFTPYTEIHQPST